MRYADEMYNLSGRLVPRYRRPPGSGRAPPPRASGGLGFTDATSNFSEPGSCAGDCARASPRVNRTATVIPRCISLSPSIMYLTPARPEMFRSKQASLGSTAAVEVFHKQDRVAAFVVDQLVNHVAGHQNAEAAGTFAGFGAHFHVTDGGILGIGNGGVRECVERETFAGIGDVNDDGFRRVQERGADALVRVVPAAVLDGVEEQLAEGGDDVLADLRGQGDFELAKKMGGAVGGVHLAPDAESDPLGAGGQDENIVRGGFGLEGLLDHVGEGDGGERRVEVAVGAGADGAEDASRVGIAGKDNLCIGLQDVQLTDELEAVQVVGALAGEHQIIELGAEALQGFTPAIGVPDGAILALQEAHQEVVDGAVWVN